MIALIINVLALIAIFCYICVMQIHYEKVLKALRKERDDLIKTNLDLGGSYRLVRVKLHKANKELLKKNV